MSGRTELLAGRVAVVTGGSSGIGRAIARLFAQQGAQVVVGDHDPLESSTAEDAQLGIVTQNCDIRREADVEQLVGRGREWGGIDILVNNAGVGLVKPLTDVTEQEWDRVLDTNLKGAFLATKHAIEPMRRRGGGTIVNIASNAGILPRAHDPVYSISKHALVGLTKSLALCHSVDRIRINAICPGPVQATRMIEAELSAAADRSVAETALINASPLARAYQRMIDPAEVAEAALYLASDASQMVTGTLIAIDGGKSLGVPPRPDR